MALTQSAAHPVPSWDEEVVPALRKRLETESRTLARRISAVSIEASEDSRNTLLVAKSMTRSPPRTSLDRKPFSDYKRARTYSQPRLNNTTQTSRLIHPVSPQKLPYNRANGAASSVVLGAPEHGTPRPTRIPVPLSRSRAGSLARTNGRPYVPYQNPPSHYDSWIGNQHIPSERITNEPAPFTGSDSSVNHSEDAYGRPSTESEERPFEHWYRGDVSRNGGVGELRVGRRQEMLEIANYGHSGQVQQKTAVRRMQLDVSMKHQRAGSVSGFVGEQERNSFYMDGQYDFDDCHTVLDETPPTDIDDAGTLSQPDDEDDDDYDTSPVDVDDSQDSRHQRGHDLSTSSAPARFDRNETPTASARTMTPTSNPRPSSRPSSRTANSRIPVTRQQGGSTSQQSSSGVVSPSPRPTRGSSEPPPSRAPVSPKAGKSKSQTVAGTARRGGPAKNSTPAKKARTMARKRPVRAADRRSVAQYPSPDADEDAIPTWTEPKQNGNWDEVVLPAVARKRGMEEHYEQVDGSPKPRSAERAVPPAPGTFGYDRSKYRPPRGEEAIPMDEFGSTIEELEPEDLAESPQSSPPRPLVSMPGDETTLPERHKSPPPFAAYAPLVPPEPVPFPRPMSHVEKQQHPAETEGDHGGGCCKCVIM
ncbi:hypothetical protein FISHEDRAFT_60190 [Fistulina hepatica ATCC 64428]|uniref:Uncharacterized protein n=1 Tax=Fistulina hepatica ATCC 64428 TaxID=1128425 RepID=A0A0D7A7H3_9AGAR|nr:hypothetical protein FISHEDRAFT_60190 [Fistulina hepatica ATCC 64428]